MHTDTFCRPRNEPPDAPWDWAGTFDAIFQVAKAKGIEVEF
jgi:cyclase